MPTIKKRAYAAKKQPEQEILTIWHQASAFVEANKKIVTIILAVVVAGLVIYGGYGLKRSMDEQSAGPLFSAAYSVYSGAAGAGPDYAKALDLFRNVHKKYPSAHSGAMAEYYAGNCLMNLGRNEEALKEYQSFTKEYGDALLNGLVNERLGYLYLSMGKQAEAIQAFERSDALTGPGAATIELARLYEAAGDSAESQKKYKMIYDKLPGTAWAMEAMGKVRTLQASPAPAVVSRGAGSAGK